MNKIIVLLTIPFFFATTVHAQDIARSDWITYMEKVLPGLICQSEQYFRQCFDVSGNNCLQVARKASIDCLTTERPNLPTKLNSVTGEQWGNIIGTCVGGKYEKRFADKKSNAPQCSDPTHWMK